MAAGPGFARVVWLDRHFTEFKLALDEASVAGMVSAGELGKAAAKEKMTHIRTGASRESIGFKVIPKNLMLFVGTLAGVMIEYGTKERTGPRGSVQADPYLRPALMLAARAFPQLMRRNVRAFRFGGGQTRIGGQFGPKL